MTTPKYHLDGLFDPARANDHDSHAIQARLIPPNTRVLELGCASGYMSGYLERAKNCRVVGVDYDPLAIQIAQTRCYKALQIDLEQPNALHAVQADAPFDVLYMANVLEHVRSAESILQQAKALLAPNAIVILVLPNIAHWQVRLQVLRGRFEYQDYGIMDRTHVHFYTVDTARALLVSQGYRVETLHIAGSFVQNQLEKIFRRSFAPILPNLLAYEMIFVAKLSH
jgi:methionine biosynthesis protein MetW